MSSLRHCWSMQGRAPPVISSSLRPHCAQRVSRGLALVAMYNVLTEQVRSVTLPQLAVVALRMQPWAHGCMDIMSCCVWSRSMAMTGWRRAPRRRSQEEEEEENNILSSVVVGSVNNVECRMSMSGPSHPVGHADDISESSQRHGLKIFSPGALEAQFNVAGGKEAGEKAWKCLEIPHEDSRQGSCQGVSVNRREISREECRR